jgi:hypothetical protein
MSLYEDTRAEDQLGKVWRGLIAVGADLLTDPVMVTIPDMDPDFRIGPCRWQSRDSSTLPLRGDQCLVVFDNNFEPWVSVWWPDTLPPPSGVGMIWRGSWSGATAYSINDVVSSGGSSYVCVLSHTNHVPPNATYWAALAGVGPAGATGAAGPVGPTGPTGQRGQTEHQLA